MTKWVLSHIKPDLTGWQDIFKATISASLSKNQITFFAWCLLQQERRKIGGLFTTEM